ncbi:hypothetical protein KBA73_02225 [Patescibacteria group bacterium]|nr:hypothetical protein [Patescibacteria group bacterium]
MHIILTTLSRFRVWLVGALALSLFALTLAIVPAYADPTPWHWQDQSDLLPTRANALLSLASERQGQWLLSDGAHLYRYDGNTGLVDLTTSTRERGIYSITNIFSDGRTWLVTARPQTQPDTMVWRTDGYSWTDVSKSFLDSRGGFTATGVNGLWLTRSYTPATSYDPSYWALSRWDGSKNQAVPLSPPSGVDTRAAGCFENTVHAVWCQGENRIITINNTFYFIGGASEVRSTTGEVTTRAQAGIWRLKDTSWIKVTDLPAIRYVSGIWPGHDSALVATSNTTNPFSPDQFWQFDGTSLSEISSQALSAGLLSTDAREIRAASDGTSWMILVGKRLVRFDGARMTDQGQTRDVFTAVSGSKGGLFILGGAVSEMGKPFSTSPITAKLVRVEEQSTDASKGGVLQEVFSKARGPRITITSTPKDLVIGNGQTFTIRVDASDTDGVAQTSIFVNGARLKTCNAARCELTQTYWTNGQSARTLPFYGSAMDRQGFTNNSGVVTLKVQQAKTPNAEATNLDGSIALPKDSVWRKDAATQTSWLSWRTDSDKQLAADQSTTVFVAAQNPKGLGRVELWINGEVKQTCDFTSSLQIRVCKITLTGAEYSANNEIFVNGRIFTSKDREAETTWTDGMRIVRNGSTAAAVSAASAAPAAAINQATVRIESVTGTVARGTTFVVRVMAHNTKEGVRRIEVLQNNTVKRLCMAGSAVSPTACDVSVDTTDIPAGTTLSFVARVQDGDSQTTWSNVSTITVSDKATQTAPTVSQNRISVWSWMAPVTSELREGQSLDYSVGAWSAANIQKMELLVDGVVRSSCAFGNVGGNRECTVHISETDFADRHTAVINARVTDYAGNKGWTEAKSVKVIRNWIATAESLPSSVSIESDRANGFAAGDRVALVARAWSANTVSKIDILVNGQVIVTCPGDVCRWTSPVMQTSQLEYQAHATDASGKSVWTGVMGISQK